MYRREPLPEALKIIASSQAGVLTRRQAREHGLGDSQIQRLLRQQNWHRLDCGLYLTEGDRPSWSQYAWAGVLLGGEGARLARESAGAMYGLCQRSLPIVVSVPHERGVASRRWAQFVRERPHPGSRNFTGRPPRTPIEETVLDLCQDADEQSLVALVTTATQRLTTPFKLTRALDQRQRIAQRRLLRDMLTETADGVRSPLEYRYRNGVERPHRLPRPARQLRLPSGRVADCGYPAFRLLIELDGIAWHSGAAAFRDWRRDNRHSEDGWQTLRYGWRDVVSDPCGVAGNVGSVLQVRGWTGTLHRCQHCPR
ncbi:hypothetical protein GCM10009841_06300 [Microlunatus panaciterrae]|uniref:Very-short-patch-repair endonuclease n=1 Tax=Microlunatus panaciterrae TaxID=400768 RepID=A0ABS2RI96_9ACTN|nr:type IV toxin-antitoxin system AbiEi family antitoxin domain-containing protein [Microlunatus panaciterrae]MBM7798716.1 very-short-patch-repair endonuclease [Microlunatus panaciterrae]